MIQAAFRCVFCLIERCVDNAGDLGELVADDQIDEIADLLCGAGFNHRDLLGVVALGGVELGAEMCVELGLDPARSIGVNCLDQHDLGIL